MSAQLIHDLPWNEYAVPGFLGSSALASWGEISLEAWAEDHMVAAYADKPGKKPSKYMENGTELDKMLTTANYDRSLIEVKPKGMSFATTDGKAWRDARVGKTIIAADDVDALDATLPRVKEFLACYEGEVRYQVTLRGEIAGMKVQTRPDMMIGANRFPDLKYINSKDYGGFERTFPYSRYVFQAGLAYGLGKESGIKDPTPSFLLAESGTTRPRVEEVTLEEWQAEWCWHKVLERVETIAKEIASPLGLTDRVKFRLMKFPKWLEREIEG